MKKLRLKKNKKASQLKNDVGSTRITNETVAEHRERILAGGRKFKYPHQYVKHKLVLNAVIITVVTLSVVLVIGWQQLYVAQNTSDFAYRATRAVPVPVATIDGQHVRYSDYLMRYRSQELWLSTKGQLGLSGADGERQLDFIKRNIIDGLENDMYAKKKAKDLGIVVTNEEVESVINDNRNTSNGTITQEVYDASTRDTLGYSPTEYKRIIMQSLLRQKVAYAIDDDAESRKEELATAIAQQNKPNLETLVSKYEKDDIELEFGTSGLVPKNNQDGGLSKAALLLEDDQVSDAIQSTTGDGYYFVQRVSGNDRQISYRYIKIPLTVFDAEVKKLRDDGRVTEYIDIVESGILNKNSKE